jgi:GNAT superfamily N-acetyltransferase
MGFIVREYRRADLAAVKEIAADTAYFGRPIDKVFPDRDLVADALIGYYAEFEPASLFVAEADGQVAGYAAGCLDSALAHDVYRRRILPRLVRRFAFGHWRRLPGLRLVKVVRVARRRSRVMRSVLPRFPAHCHVNVARGFRGMGIGRALLGRFIELVRARGVAGVHVSTASEGGRRLAAGAGFATLARVPVHDVAGGPPRAGWIMGARLA